MCRHDRNGNQKSERSCAGKICFTFHFQVPTTLGLSRSDVINVQLVLSHFAVKGGSANPETTRDLGHMPGVIIYRELDQVAFNIFKRAKMTRTCWPSCKGVVHWTCHCSPWAITAPQNGLPATT